MIYRIQWRDDMCESKGASFFDTRKEAIIALGEMSISIPDRIGELDEIPVPKTKKQTIALLNRIAGHPDNG